MFASSFMLQDMRGVLIAVLLFTTILVFPGFLTGYFFDILNFRTRQSFMQFGIATILSVSISPIIFFLAYRLVSGKFTIFLVVCFTLIFTILTIRLKTIPKLFQEIRQTPQLQVSVVIAGLWILAETIFLIDIQWGNRLYFNIISYDYATRASVINAITRTGVPPLNPSYYPGTPQLLTYLYYFWYVLCSLIDQIGGELVNSRTALMASAIWTGLALMAVTALFTRLRSPKDNMNRIWQKAGLGIGLLFVSGLDIIPSTIYIIFPKFLAGRFLEGDIEHWNEQITAWIGSTNWTPHHVISIIACLLAWMLTQFSQNDSLLKQLSAGFIAGLALASAFGLSVWVTLVFVVFWGIWGISRFIYLKSARKLWTMIYPGVVAGLAILPFVLDLFKTTGSSTENQFPFMIYMRPFYPLDILQVFFPALDMLLLYTLAIPLNYFFELGFFFVVALLWLQLFAKKGQTENRFASQENLLLLVVIVLTTFVRSTVISNNDFGWRGWMFGQFILIFWGVEVIQYVWNKNISDRINLLKKQLPVGRIRLLISSLIIIGILTSVFDAALLRTWPILVDTGMFGLPRFLTPDNHLGDRTFATRAAFTFIDNNLPPEAIIQFDPRFKFDSPAGLYRTQGTVISYYTLYGVPISGYKPLIDEVGSIFDRKNNRWQLIDPTCQKYRIDYLILRDWDPIWTNLHMLKAERNPIYENRYVAVFKCSP